jgi:hypothetical protein
MLSITLFFMCFLSSASCIRLVFDDSEMWLIINVKKGIASSSVGEGYLL